MIIPTKQCTQPYMLFGRPFTHTQTASGAFPKPCPRRRHVYRVTGRARLSIFRARIIRGTSNGFLTCASLDDNMHDLQRKLTLLCRNAGQLVTAFPKHCDGLCGIVHEPWFCSCDKAFCANWPALFGASLGGR